MAACARAGATGQQLRPGLPGLLLRQRIDRSHAAAGCSPGPAAACLEQLLSRPRCSVLLGVDIYSFEQKISHIARRVNLPEPPQLGPGYHALQGEQRIPPILVINVQLPTYSVQPTADLCTRWCRRTPKRWPAQRRWHCDCGGFSTGAAPAGLGSHAACRLAHNQPAHAALQHQLLTADGWHRTALQPSMWGPMDGKGQSLVYYFSLPQGWEPDQLDNPAALALAQRFVHNGRESDKCAPLPCSLQAGRARQLLQIWWVLRLAVCTCWMHEHAGRCLQVPGCQQRGARSYVWHRPLCWTQAPRAQGPLQGQAQARRVLVGLRRPVRAGPPPGTGSSSSRGWPTWRSGPRRAPCRARRRA